MGEGGFKDIRLESWRVPSSISKTTAKVEGTAKIRQQLVLLLKRMKRK